MYHHLSFTKSSTSKSHWGGCWDSFHLILRVESFTICPSLFKPFWLVSQSCWHSLWLPWWLIFHAQFEPQEAQMKHCFWMWVWALQWNWLFASVESTDGPSGRGDQPPAHWTGQGRGRKDEGRSHLFLPQGLSGSITVPSSPAQKGIYTIDSLGS